MPSKKSCDSWQDAEKLALKELREKFKKEFIKSKKDIKIANKTREFDFVSVNDKKNIDMKIVAQVKYCEKQRDTLTDAQIVTRFRRGYLYDCLLLEKVEATHKLFFLASDKQLFEEFEKWVEGLISKKVKLQHLNIWE